MITIGIDSGKSGGVAYMDNDNIFMAHDLYPISDMIGEIHQFIHEHGRTKVRAVIEEPPSFIKMIPASRSYQMGVSFGECKGICQGALIQTICIRPQVWQKGLTGLKGKQGPARKKGLKDHAFRLYPSLKPTLKTADAILILHQSKNII